MGMSPTDIETIARAKYNATNDTFFTPQEIQYYIWQASHIIARNSFCIERTYTTSTIAGTQTYNFPTNTIAIKRITVGGRKLKKITMRQDDAITLTNQAVTTQGWPIYYYEWDLNIYLRPIPDTIYTMNIFSINDAQQITSTSSIEVPSLFHMDIVDYVVGEMYAKDQNLEQAQYFRGLWKEHVLEARRWKAIHKRADSFTTVESEDVLPVTILGEA